MGSQSNEISQEDWNSYRKLVVDTLRRLDERTLDLFKEMTDMTARVHTLEQVDYERDIEKLQDEMRDIRNELNVFKQDASNKFAVVKGVTWVLGIIWTAGIAVGGIVIGILGLK